MVNKLKQAKKERNKKDKEWREKILEKHDNQCFICGDTKMPNAHHIIPKNFKLTRWDEANGILLCPKHHKFGNFSAHGNPLWFISILMNDSTKYSYLISKLKILELENE